MVAGQAIGVAAPEHAADSAAEHIHETHGIHIGDRRRARDGDRIAPAVAALVDPESDLGIVHIDDIRQAIAIHIADQDAPGVIAVGKPRAVLHVDALAPIAVAEVGPVLDVAVVHESDVLQTVAREVGPFDARVGKVDVGKDCERLAFDPARVVPALFRVIEKAFQATSGTNGVGDAVAVEIDELDLRIFEVETRGLAVALERAPIPLPPKLSGK